MSSKPSEPAAGSIASTGIDSAMHEKRVFPPGPAAQVGFASWHVATMEDYRAMHKRSVEDPEGFWGEVAKGFAWTRPWSRVLEWNPPDPKWFVGGQTNVCFNCVDRHVESGHGDDTAIIWEGEPMPGGKAEVRRVSYAELRDMTARFGNMLVELGVKKGDVVTIYMPMIPELAAAVLGCARIGAVHSVIFGGFAPHAIIERVKDASSRVIVTADGGWRRGAVVDLKKNVDEACDRLAEEGFAVSSVLVAKRCGNTVGMKNGRDHWWHELEQRVDIDCPCEPMDAEAMLFLLYTSGSTGKPKGIVHTTGGYMVYVGATARWTFNLRPGENQVFWCTADVGWVTGHSYVLYGILANRVPTLMFEGAPDSPGKDRFWDIIERHKVTHLYTAPTAIRAFMKWGDEFPAKHNMKSLRLMGSVGEPINPEAWMWYRKHIGGERCPIVDTYWQTETGGHICTPLPGATPTKPGSCTLAMFGIDAAIVNEQGVELPPDKGGLFVIRKPWPGMLRGVHGNRERFVSNYWQRVKDPKTGQPYYFSADGARRDGDGYFWIQGRIDDVIKVSGHLLGTMEVESALVSHAAVAEAAVVGMPHEIKGSGICAFVTLKMDWLKANAGRGPDDALKAELAAHVAKEIGAIARPDQVRFADGLPKTRSGKIMRRLLRDVAAGVEKITQDTTTLEDFSVVAKLRESDEE